MELGSQISEQFIAILAGEPLTGAQYMLLYFKS
jgi:hypothetical protein